MDLKSVLESNGRLCVVIITGEHESVKIERKSQDRSQGVLTHQGVGRGRAALQKKCDTDKVTKKSVSWVYQLSRVPFSRASCIATSRGRSLNRMTLKLNKKLTSREGERAVIKSGIYDYKMICLKWERLADTLR